MGLTNFSRCEIGRGDRFRTRKSLPKLPEGKETVKQCFPYINNIERLAFGKGYRVYFAQEGDKVILLLCGGDKGSQDKDIRQAKAYLQDYRRREHGKKK